MDFVRSALLRKGVALAITLAGAVLVAACGGAPQPTPTPTRTPPPTFTPTPEGRSLVAAYANAAVIVPTPTPTPTSTPTPTPTSTPTPTPTPKPEAIVRAQRLNVRMGPNVLHPRITQVSAGDRLEIVAKNPAGTWWQVRLPDGTEGWVSAALVEAVGPVEEVPVAAVIPTPPPTPTPTFTPTPTATPTPSPTPTPAYMFNKVVVYGCTHNAGVTEVHGTVYVNGQPANGYLVAFSWAPDGPIISAIPSGPHEGYPDWAPGFYSHILQANKPREGDWYFWIIDSSGRRISRIAHVHTDAEAVPGKCQQWVIDFDTR